MQRVFGAKKIKASSSGWGGFTLTELLVVIAIMAALVAIAIPRFIALRPARQLNGATRAVLGQLYWARARAVEENNQFVVSFATSHSLTILDDKNNNGTADAGEATWTRDLQTDYPGVTLSKGAGNPDPIFVPRGTVGGTTTVAVTNSSGSRTLTVNVTGVITIS